MDAPTTDETSNLHMLIAQRDEIKKTFSVPQASFLEEVVNKGEGFENHDPTVDKPDPYTIHQRMFKVKNLLGDEEKTVIVSTTKQDGFIKTTFSMVKMTTDGRAANRFDISYSSQSDKGPSVMTVNAVPSNQMEGISFNLDSQDRISPTDDTTRNIRHPVFDIHKNPPELKTFNGMRIDGLKASPDNLSFQMHGFPYAKSGSITMNLPRTLKR